MSLHVPWSVAPVRREHMRLRVLILPAAAAAMIAMAGCGSSSKRASAGSSSAQTTTFLPPAVAELSAAEHPSATQFPAANGRSLQKLAALVSGSVQLGPATGVFAPGTGRFAFALNTSSGA